MKFNVNKQITPRLINALHSLFEESARKANQRIGETDDEKNSRIVKKDGGYKCIHLQPAEFFESLELVLNHRKVHDGGPPVHDIKFLDIGCGVGEKIFMADLLGLTAFGLELRPELISEGKQVFKSFGYQTERYVFHQEPEDQKDCFIQANALTYDYSGFDILYFYCPLEDRDLQRQLEDQIVKTASPGAIVIPKLPMGVFGDYSKPPAEWESVTAKFGGKGFFVKKGKGRLDI